MSDGINNASENLENDLSQSEISQSNRTLKMPGLKSTDWFLYKEIKEYFQLSSMREVFVLGLRLIYTFWHDRELRDRMFSVVNEVRRDDLNRSKKDVVYSKFEDI